MCLTCQWKMGISSVMQEIHTGIFQCSVCKTTRATEMAAPVLRAGLQGLQSVLFVGSFLLLLLATVVFDAYPGLQVPLTWTALYSMYLIYFGMASVNLKRKAYG